MGSLIGVARYFTRSWRVSPLALSLSERIRLLDSVVKEHWLVSLFKQTVADCLNRMANSLLEKRGPTSIYINDENKGYLISKDKILVINRV